MARLGRAAGDRVEKRRLGRTGHESSIVILGGAAFASATAEEANAGLEVAVSRGVNHLDIAPSYGQAEEAVSPSMPDFVDKLFVGCKSRRRNPDGVRAQMNESLEKLKLERFDLYQAHGVTDIETLDERGDAFSVMLKARDEGLTRFVGITGHDLGAPAAHLEALRRYDLDTVMFPIYPRVWARPNYRDDVRLLLNECADRDVGVQVTKALAKRPWGDRELTHSTWYEPQTTQHGIQRGVDFALSTVGVHALCTPGDLGLLRDVLDAADKYTPMTSEQRARAMSTMSEDELIFPLSENARRAE
ncbi:MAG: aldo/keto reductase [Acidimicrobiales bacterium]